MLRTVAVPVLLLTALASCAAPSVVGSWRNTTRIADIPPEELVLVLRPDGTGVFVLPQIKFYSSWDAFEYTFHEGRLYTFVKVRKDDEAPRLVTVFTVEFIGAERDRVRVNLYGSSDRALMYGSLIGIGTANRVRENLFLTTLVGEQDTLFKDMVFRRVEGTAKTDSAKRPDDGRLWVLTHSFTFRGTAPSAHPRRRRRSRRPLRDSDPAEHSEAATERSEGGWGGQLTRLELFWSGAARHGGPA